jgi:hypothetical protein
LDGKLDLFSDDLKCDLVKVDGLFDDSFMVLVATRLLLVTVVFVILEFERVLGATRRLVKAETLSVSSDDFDLERVFGATRRLVKAETLSVSSDDFDLERVFGATRRLVKAETLSVSSEDFDLERVLGATRRLVKAGAVFVSSEDFDLERVLGATRRLVKAGALSVSSEDFDLERVLGATRRLVKAGAVFVSSEDFVLERVLGATRRLAIVDEILLVVVVVVVVVVVLDGILVVGEVDEFTAGLELLTTVFGTSRRRRANVEVALVDTFAAGLELVEALGVTRLRGTFAAAPEILFNLEFGDVGELENVLFVTRVLARIAAFLVASVDDRDVGECVILMSDGFVSTECSCFVGETLRLGCIFNKAELDAAGETLLFGLFSFLDSTGGTSFVVGETTFFPSCIGTLAIGD